MKTTGIVLIVVAVILGVLIVLDIMLEKKKKARAAVTLATKQPQIDKPQPETVTVEAQPTVLVPTVVESTAKPTAVEDTEDDEVEEIKRDLIVVTRVASVQSVAEAEAEGAEENEAVADESVEDDEETMPVAVESIEDTEEIEPVAAESIEDTEEIGSVAVESVEDEAEEVSSELKVVVENGQARYIVIKYSKSFQAKLIQGSDETKRYYSEIKNCLMSYGVKSRMSWKWESFRYGRKTLAKFRLRGKTLSLVLALNPDDYAETKYLVENVSEIKVYVDTPCLYRIKNERRLNYSKELIAKLMQDNGLTLDPSYATADYAARYPYETTEALIERKLIKVLTDEDAQSGQTFKPSEIRHSVQAQEVDKILMDEVAAELIEKADDGVSDRTKTGIINVDTLSQCFADGETVTLDEIKKRIKGFGKTTYIKVLARGTLDKQLTVEADDFSLQAVKMIVLLGGKVIKK